MRLKSRVSKALAVASAFIVGIVLSMPVVQSQVPNLLFGSASGVAQPIKATSNSLWVAIQGVTAGTGTQTGKVPVTIYADVTATGSTGGGAAADVSSYTMPANTLSANGQKLTFYAAAQHAANTNATTFQMFVFGTGLSTLANAGSGGMSAGIVTIQRTSSTTATVFGDEHSPATFAQIRTFLTGLDFTAPLIIKYQVTAATTTNDLIGNGMHVEWWPLAS